MGSSVVPMRKPLHHEKPMKLCQCCNSVTNNDAQETCSNCGEASWAPFADDWKRPEDSKPEQSKGKRR